FQACVTCDLAQDPGNITLSVDMNQYEGPEIVGDSSVFVSGQFNSWCGDCNMLTHNGDGTYTGTVLMPAGQNEYKFQINNWADDESFVGGEECTLTTGEFTNRVLDVNGDAIVDMVCFESCTACAAPCTLADSAPVGLTKSQQPVPFPDGDIDRAQVKWYKDTPDVKYSADDNTAVDIEFWPIRDLVTNTPITNGDTTLLSKRTKPNKDLFKWPVKYIRPDINPNTRYRWRVRIYCDAGNGPVSPWSVEKNFNTPDFDPATGIYTPPPGAQYINGDWKVLDGAIEFDLFPNPSDGNTITLTLDEVTEGPVDMIVYSLSGEMVHRYTGPVKGLTMNIDFDKTLAAGMYFINLESQGSVTNARFVVR
ncbi:MAG: T9SS type A sorting domain-containing protein, partial [Flavobacteriales bacterium]|nr:T9SS type A sorting domain-containing protein [Flavobacteriales bacterium]